MKLEKVVQLENGSEAKILVSIWVDSVKNEFAYNHAITIKPKGKKEFSIAQLKLIKPLKWLKPNFGRSLNPNQ
jgi:hypothetical protein